MKPLYLQEKRTCTGCGEEKPIDDFYWRRSRCKKCEHVRIKGYQKRLQAICDEAKSRPCMDCGQSFPPWVMDFDHRDGDEKDFVIANSIARCVSQEALRAEIEKCDVVCSNCHRMRTHARKNGAGWHLTGILVT